MFFGVAPRKSARVVPLGPPAWLVGPVTAISALLDLEPQLRRIKDYRTLPLLQHVLHTYVEKGKKSAA